MERAAKRISQKKKQLVICVMLCCLIILMAGGLLVTGQISFLLPGKTLCLEESVLYAEIKDFERRENNLLISKSADPWLDIQIPEGRYCRVLIDVEAIYKRSRSITKSTTCRVFFGVSKEADFSTEESGKITLLRGINEVELPDTNINRLKLNLTNEANVQIRLQGVSVVSRTDLHVKRDVLWILLPALAACLLAIPISGMIVRYYDSAEKKLFRLVNSKPRQVLALLMILSSLICFWNYLIGKKYFVFLDIGTDAVCAYQPFFLSFADDLKEGRVAEWTLNYGLGTSTLEQLSWGLDPFVWPTILAYLVSDFHTAQVSIAWMQALKCFLCAFACYEFLCEFRLGNSAKIVTAYAFGFCGFLVLWGQHYRFSTCFCFTSVCFLHLERALKERYIFKNHLLFAVLTAWLASVSYYFAYMSLIAMTVYTIIRIIMICRFKNAKKWIAKGLRIAGMMVLGITIAGAIFAPRVVEILTVSNRIKQCNDLAEFIGFWPKNNALTIVCRFLSNNLQGSKHYQGTRNYYESEQLFFSSFQLLLFGIYVFCGLKDGWKTAISRFSAIAMMILLPFLPITGVIFNGFVEPTARYTYVFMPFYAIIFATAIDEIFQKKVSIFQMLCAALFYCVIFCFARKANGIKKEYYFLIGAEFLFLIVILILFLRTNRYEKALKLTMIAVILFNIGTDTWITNNNRISISNHYEHYTLAESTAEVKEIHNYLAETDPELYRIEKSYTNYTWFNDAMVEDYYGISYYNNAENGGIQEFFKNCWDKVIFKSESIYIQFERDLENSGMAALLGVKYIISDVPIENAPEYQYLDSVAGKYIYLNTDYKGFGRFFTGVVSSNEFLSYREDSRDRILTENLLLDFHSNPEKAEGKVYFEPPQKEDLLIGKADANADGFVFIPIAYENGWSATVNEKSVNILKADYGFMAIPVEAGATNITLEYDIPWLRQGAMLSAAGIVTMIGLMAFNRRGRKRVDFV